MRLNSDKCHLILSDCKIKTTNVGDFTIKSTKIENLPGVTFDNKLIFNLT